MSRPDDPSDDMSRFPSSAEADRLLGGRVSPDDLPDEAAPLARLLKGLVPGAANDPFTEHRVVSDMVAEILRNPAPEAMPSLLRSSGSRVSAKAGALAFAAVLATGTAAAAANGSLPAGVQRAVSDALSHVSISVPRPAPHRPQPVESQHGGPDESPNGGSPGGATGPVGPRGVGHGNDDDKTPRGPTNATPGSTRSPGQGGNGNNGSPSSVPNGPKTTNPGGTNPNRGPGNDSGRHNGDEQGQHNGADQGQNTGQTGPPPATTTTTTVKPGKPKVKDKGKDDSNAGGTQEDGNANSHASPEVSGSGPGGRT
jgi:hypothetical protein